mmetsp:Transcript_7672/g.17375  ORF Transcript_7672/g.17375 Transcript_7672/m.17375 type:complete len:573 (-) Transcript_7672:101-1819(-)|eukprot:CAMPEP_0172309032 /NCGR_PEP_ID=MMETSP1058-20130122/9446_1 /TAXON_ID=83371 /ORGANISM="Detonula confervacea, Strain CCMP 353" /LENGTH=572 /DNA_ID=CAMNT_0013021583 /DNA_START=56 /DNA_END=1771 /DNA_ORIENTATION=+
MTKSDSEKEEELTSAKILRLLVPDDNDDGCQPLTGETMEMLSHRIKADVRCINIDEFMMLAQRKRKRTQKHNGGTTPIPRPIPICDARSPGEFAIGHIPGATNLPLFTNEERATVGTSYNTTGRSSAMVLGMSIVRPKLEALVSTAAAIVANAKITARTDDTCNGNGDSDDSDEDDMLLLHCWRGGMRSCALAFLVQARIPGLTVYVLKDGYKAFRQWQYNIYCYLPENASYSDNYSDTDVNAGNSVSGTNGHRKGKNMSQKQRLKFAARQASATGIGIAKREAAIAKVRADRGLKDVTDVVAAEAQRKSDADASIRAEAEWAKIFDKGPNIAIVGGPTGSGKTRVLHYLRDVLGEQIIDLEGLANHSGSAFGFVGHENAPQPTPQQYTNNVAMQWNSLDPERWVFIEDEGPNVGRVNLPVGLYRKMRSASAVLKLDIPKDIRVEVLREDYALPEKKELTTDQNLSEWLCNMIEATRTLEKRIGQVRMNTMINMLRGGHSAEFASAALEYYDDLYDKHIANEHGSANMKGNGERAATISTVTVENMEKFDAEAVSRQVLASLTLLTLKPPEE